MSGEVALFIDPTSPRFERDALFDLGGNIYAGDHINAPYARLKDWFEQRDVSVHTADLLDDRSDDLRKVYISLGIRDRWPRLAGRDDVVLSAFLALECPIVEPRLYLDLDQAARQFGRLYSFSDARSLRPFLRAPLTFHSFRIPQAFDAVHDACWTRTDRRFLVMINANKRPRLAAHELYSERLRALAHFERAGDIDLYGLGWDGPPYRTGVTRVPATVRRVVRRMGREAGRIRLDPLLASARRCWQGPAPSKSEVLSGYHFSLCYENMILPGWITEKIFDCLLSGTIPVYLGAPDIDQWVPPECFVDMRHFAGYADLSDYLHSLGAKDRQMFREAARAFVGSQAYYPFSSAAFIRLVADLVEADSGIRL